MMIHPSYKEMLNAVNEENAENQDPVISSRYSIVMATAKRARQIIDGDEPMIIAGEKQKPLSSAVEEVYEGLVHIQSEEN